MKRTWAQVGGELPCAQSKTTHNTGTSPIIRYALFWDITQRRVAIRYRSFGTTYRSHQQGSRSARRRWDQLVVPQRIYGIATAQ
jgi:hypothetical protein